MPTKYKGSPRQLKSLNAYICFHRASESINQRLSRHFNQDGFTLAQFSLLECLYHNGPMNPTSLATKTMRSCGNMTFVMDKLESKGWLKRELNPKERRSYNIVLLDKGRSMVEKWLPIYVDNIVEEMSLLSAKQLDELRALSKIIGIVPEGAHK